MPQLPGSPWSGALVAIVLMLLAMVLLYRYLRLEREGTALPPGAGGARMVGTIGTVVADHVPGSSRGRVRVLGEDWGVADAVVVPLRTGETVRIEEVTGTRLVVARLRGAETDPTGDPAAPEADERPDPHDLRRS